MASRRKPFDKSFFVNFRFAFRGLGLLFRDERNARFHLIAAVVVVALGAWLGMTPGEWASVAVVIALVVAAEAFNSAIERLCDHTCPDHNPLIGQVKDLAAGGVLAAALAAAVVGLIIFVPKLIALIA